LKSDGVIGRDNNILTKCGGLHVRGFQAGRDLRKTIWRFQTQKSDSGGYIWDCRGAAMVRRRVESGLKVKRLGTNNGSKEGKEATGGF